MMLWSARVADGARLPIGYMQDDPGYNRFFSYISLFTFSMLMLVSRTTSAAVLRLEAVGWCRIADRFWYTRPTAIYASLKLSSSTASAISVSCSHRTRAMYFGTLITRRYSATPAAFRQRLKFCRPRMVADDGDLYPAVRRAMASRHSSAHVWLPIRWKVRRPFRP